MSPQAPVVVIGGAVVDVVFRARPGPRSSAAAMAGTSTPAELQRRSLGGVGRNICEALARCGAGPLRFASVVGDDPDGQFVAAAAREALNPAGPGLAATDVDIAVIKGAATATYIALLDGTGELTAAVAAMGIFDKHLSPEWLQHHPGLLTAVRAARCVVLDGNVPATVMTAMAAAGTALPKGEIPLAALDPISATKVLRLEPALRSLPPRKRYAFLLKPNGREAAELAGAIERDEAGKASVEGHLPAAEAKTPERIMACCRRILRSTGVDIVVCTAGALGAVVAVKLGALDVATADAAIATAPGWGILERGCSCAPALAAMLVPSVPLGTAQIVKVTGCGDTFLACTTASLLRAPRWAEAVVPQSIRPMAGEEGAAAATRCLAALRSAAEAGARGARQALVSTEAIPRTLTPAVLAPPAKL